MINYDNITIQDCLDMYSKKNMVAVINDGKVLDFEKEKNNGSAE